MIESVRDPGNMGTILRNAVAFGIDKLVLSSDCVDIYSPKVVRSSMGAIFKINITVFNNIFNLFFHSMQQVEQQELSLILKMEFHTQFSIYE